jgi:anti-sigma factor RsiW
MRCLDDVLIQKYVDCETSLKENSIIRKHISVCPECGEKIETAKQFTLQVKEALQSIQEEEPEIPVLNLPERIEDRKAFKLRSALYGLSAASLFVAALVFSLNQKDVSEEELYLLFNHGWEYDANRTISEQDMTMGIIDNDGNFREYFETQ